MAIDTFHLLPAILKTLDRASVGLPTPESFPSAGVNIPLINLSTVNLNLIAVDSVLDPSVKYYTIYSYYINGVWGGGVQDEFYFSAVNNQIVIPPSPPGVTVATGVHYQVQIFSDPAYTQVLYTYSTLTSQQGWTIQSIGPIEASLRAFGGFLTASASTIQGLKNLNNPLAIPPGPQLVALSSNFGYMVGGALPSRTQQNLVGNLTQFNRAVGTPFGLYQFFSYSAYPQQIYYVKELWKTQVNETENYSGTEGSPYTIKSARFEIFGPFSSNSTVNTGLPDGDALPYDTAYPIYLQIADKVAANDFLVVRSHPVNISDYVSSITDVLVISVGVTPPIPGTHNSFTFTDSLNSLSDKIYIATEGTPPCFPSFSSQCAVSGDAAGDVENQLQNQKNALTHIISQMDKIYPTYITDISQAALPNSNDYFMGTPSVATSLDTLPLTSTDLYFTYTPGQTKINFVKLGVGSFNLTSRAASTLSPALMNKDTIDCTILPPEIYKDTNVNASSPDGVTYTGTLSHWPHVKTVVLVAELQTIEQPLTSPYNSGDGTMVVFNATGFGVGQTIQVGGSGGYEYRQITAINGNSLSIGCAFGGNFSSGTAVKQLPYRLVAYTDQMEAPPIVTIDPPPNGTTATATAVVSGGAVTEIIVTNTGSEYTTSPNITISGAAGAGASATAVLGVGGMVVSITVNAGGSGYGVPTTTSWPWTVRGDVDPSYNNLIDYRDQAHQFPWSIKWSKQPPYGSTIYALYYRETKCIYTKVGPEDQVSGNFPAQITGSTPVTGNTNQWTYAFQEVTNSGTTAGTVQNTWSALAGGVTGTAINLAEAANVTTGTGNTAPTAVLSTGWNSTNFGATTNLAAIPNNSIVMVSSTLDNATPPNMVYTFFVANVVQGGC